MLLRQHNRQMQPSFRDELAQTTDFPTILGKLGKFSFNPDGDALYDQIIMVVKDGKLMFFD